MDVTMNEKRESFSSDRPDNALLTKAMQILDIMRADNIYTSVIFSNILTLVRDFTATGSAKMLAPNLTANVATTKLGLGLCQELSQRFILEYVLKFKEINVSILFLAKPGVRNGKRDHAFLYLGPLDIPNELFVNQGSSNESTLPNASQPLLQFLKANQAGVLADPLLGFANVCSGDLTPLFNYSKKYDVTHIIGVRSFANTSGLIENAPVIEKNAELIAGVLRSRVNSEIRKKLSFLSLFPNPPKSRSIQSLDADGEPTINFEFYNKR